MLPLSNEGWDSGLNTALFGSYSCTPVDISGRPQSRFCHWCGHAYARRNSTLATAAYPQSCSVCGHVTYLNPLVTSACVLRVGGRVLLSRRAIEPRAGCWTIPGGYVEAGETTEQAARRELAEETSVSVDRVGLTALYELPQINQICFVYTAHVGSCRASPGPESDAVQLSDFAVAPWDTLAFPTDRRVLYRLQTHVSEYSIEVGKFWWGTDGRILLLAGASGVAIRG